MSVPLLQQELMEPEPQRKLIVRPGMVHHWGVDPSTQRIAIASGDRVQTHSFPRTDGLARLADIYDSTKVELLDEIGEVAPSPRTTRASS